MNGFRVFLNCGNVKFSCGAMVVSFAALFLKLILICDSRNYFVFRCSKKDGDNWLMFTCSTRSSPSPTLPVSCVIAAARLIASYSLLVKWFWFWLWSFLIYGQISMPLRWGHKSSLLLWNMVFTVAYKELVTLLCAVHISIGQYGLVN